jgi:hypothetical protein
VTDSISYLYLNHHKVCGQQLCSSQASTRRGD